MAEVESAGAFVVLVGDELRVRGAAALPESLMRELREHRDDIREALAPRRQNLWPRDTQEIIDWFLKSQPPRQPFLLRRGVFIAVPAEYWKYLHADIVTGPGTARDYCGAVQADLRQLHKLFASDREAA